MAPPRDATPTWSPLSVFIWTSSWLPVDHLGALRFGLGWSESPIPASPVSLGYRHPWRRHRLCLPRRSLRAYEPAPLDLRWTVEIKMYLFGIWPVHRGPMDLVHGAASALAQATWCTAPTSSRHVSDESAAPVNTRSTAPILQNSPSVFSESTRSPF